MKLNFNCEGLLSYIYGTINKNNSPEVAQERRDWVVSLVGDGGIRLGGYSSNFSTAKLGVKGYGYIDINGLETPKDYPSKVNFVQDIKKLFPENDIMYTHSVHSWETKFEFASNVLKPSVIELGNEVYLKKYEKSSMDLGVDFLSAQGHISAYGQFSQLCINIPPKKDSTFLSMVKNTKYLNIDAISIHAYKNNPEEIIELVQFLENYTGKDVYVSEVHLDLKHIVDNPTIYQDMIYKGKLQIFGGELHPKAKDRNERMEKRDALKEYAAPKFKSLVKGLYESGINFHIQNLAGNGHWAMINKHGLTIWGLAINELKNELS